MDYTSELNKYGPGNPATDELWRNINERTAKNSNTEVYKACYGMIDLTSLNVTDSRRTISEFATRTVEFTSEYPDMNNVASICVFPNFVETVGIATGDSCIPITSVSGGFPASQTFLEVKMLEASMAVENGADEVDIVLNVGQFLDGEFDEAGNEIELIRDEVGPDTVLKVIIESGALADPETIRRASLLSMLAGADFVKTSTGKISVAATPEAALTICQAIRDYYENTGRKVGFKAAGGIKNAPDAAHYYSIVEEILGPDWLTPSLFRIGASSAANAILSAIYGTEIKYY